MSHRRTVSDTRGFFSFSQVGSGSHTVTANFQGQPAATRNYNVGGQQGIVTLQIWGYQTTAGAAPSPNPPKPTPDMTSAKI